jgi:hypothetical protein
MFEYIWTSDEHAEVFFNGKLVGEIDHGAHGWDGMDAVQEIVTEIAGVLGVPVKHFERYLDEEE